MRAVSVTKHLTSGAANVIATAQTLTAAGNLVLNGGSVTTMPLGKFGADVTVAVLDTQRRIQIISDGNDSARSATIHGFRQNGQPISEVLALTNAGTAVSALDYLTVGPTISVDGAIANHVTIGTNGTGSTDWIMANFHLTPFEININDQVSGTVTWNLETTNDTYWTTPPGPQDTTPQPNVNAIISGSTIAQQTTLNSPVTGYRFTITAGTGTLSAQALQGGITNM